MDGRDKTSKTDLEKQSDAGNKLVLYETYRTVFREHNKVKIHHKRCRQEENREKGDIIRVQSWHG